jgi:hypothetical protein
MANGKNRLSEYIEFERKVVSLEQIERTVNMVHMDKYLDKFFMALMIQFGYINIFHGVFPGSSIIIVLANMFIIFLT